VFDIPERYKTDNIIAVKNFTPRDMKKADRDKIRANLITARLVWQVQNEDVPSVIDDSHNYTVIMGLDVQIKSIKLAAFFADAIQPLMKAPCVIRLHDGTDECYSYAYKRLNLTDNTQIVVANSVLTEPSPIALPDKPARLLREYASWDALRGKSDKLTLYTEVLVKAFITSNLNLFSGMERLLSGNVWYNRKDTLALFTKLKDLQETKLAADREPLPGERAKLLGKVRQIIKEI
jgi:hypothetical protein